MNSSPIRFTGLTSGMDTNAMVQSIMRAENMRMHRLTARRQVLQWRQEDLRATRHQLVDFRSNIVPATPRHDQNTITNPNTWNTMRAAVTGVNGGSTDGITVTANAQARAQNLRMEVVQTAAAQFSVGAHVDADERQIIENSWFGGGVITINGVEVTLEAGTVQSAIAQFNRSGIDATIRFDTLRGAFAIEGSRAGDELNVTADTGYLLTRLRLSDASAMEPGPDVPLYDDPPPTEFFTREWNSTTNAWDFVLIDPAILALNEGEPGFIPTAERFMRREREIANPDYPADPPVPEFITEYYFVLAYRRGPLQPVTGATGDPLSLDNATARGTEARLAHVRLYDNHGAITNPAVPPPVAGDPYIFTYTSNVIRTLVEGVTIDISGARGRIDPTDPTEPGQTVNINVHRNVDDVMAAIRDFVEEYNNLIRQLNTIHTTPRPRAGGSRTGALFEPLNDEQRAGMSDREIERWEEQARQGLLHRDNDIRNIHQQLRTAMMQPVRLGDGTEVFLFHAGITTVGMDGPAEDRLIGVLQIDEDRLRAELESDPERIRQLFARNWVDAGVERDGVPLPGGNIRDRNARAPYIGLAFRLNDVINNVAEDHDSILRQRVGVVGLVDSSENIMSRQIRDYDRRIEQMQQWLIRRENHFFAMFARMEQAMAQSHQQMDALFAFAMQ